MLEKGKVSNRDSTDKAAQVTGLEAAEMDG